MCFADQLSAEIGGHFSLFSVSPRDSMSYEILLSQLNRACAAVLKDVNQSRCSASLFSHDIRKAGFLVTLKHHTILCDCLLEVIMEG